jgi:hypothetical protein
LCLAYFASANKFEEFVDAVDKDGLGRMDANDWLRQTNPTTPD